MMSLCRQRMGRINKKRKVLGYSSGLEVCAPHSLEIQILRPYFRLPELGTLRVKAPR